MEPELDRFWPRLNPVCENPRFQPPPALLKIEQLTFTTSGVSGVGIERACGFFVQRRKTLSFVGFPSAEQVVAVITTARLLSSAPRARHR